MSKILTIEDDKFLRELIKRKLQEVGFEATSASNGEEGLALVKEEKPDLILLDLIMPDMDGFMTLKELQKDHLLASIPVIILSNLGQQDDIDKAKQLGAVDFLVKAHFTPNEIIDKINKILNKKES
ncbi:response regulator [bacterium (Candidatus Gribaldobacteria) CG10_big_fil_rev_8_21_14_0_10_37_21]|uniref:Response regulator n=1 Tax=bacterium (Candidatus Gribaldobacteria) CG10_big_fil_rev_8_21_14_0_10_37_21 TaxID=2014275 RepID=A0A2H0UTL8_9BACT|nr:MAG: response regulator [Parcubacteria group bacterium CG1_02_37_13]PIR89968.1 MAG: response regulator [bacterium (Candidatus Gribaldobacteria) CG10_big_fil_rev_8_21_14_0_10_37_21]